MKSLAKGVWCKECEYFEDPADLGNQTCLACGCDNEYHVKVKIVQDKDEEELVEWELDLPIKVHNILKKKGIETMGQLREVINADPRDFNAVTLHDLRGIGLKSYEQIKDQFRRWEEQT